MKNSMVSFGKRISELRKKEGITLAQLGDVAGISKSGVSHWEKSNIVPSADILAKLAVFFGVTVDYLLGIENKSVDNQNVVLLNRGFNNLDNDDQEKALKILNASFDDMFKKGVIEEDDDEF